MKKRVFFKKYIDKAFIRNTLLIAGTVFALFFFSGFVTVYQIAQDKNFATGVSIDGINVSGMTYDEAEQVVLANAEKLLEDVHISLVYLGNTTGLNSDDMGVNLNINEVLSEAYSYNKDEIDSYEQRYNKTVKLSNGLNFNTDIIIDKAKLRETIEQYTELYNRQPIDAIASYNKNTCLFSYTEEQYGAKISTDYLIDRITAMLNEKDYSTVQVSSDVISPSIVLSELKENTVLIAEYETTAYFNEKRNTNVQLICNVVDGIEIRPGEIISVNELAGERTAEKGYEAAPAIIHGVTVDDIGGGICQLAGTLYNAILLTDLKIVERVRHTWPSSYLPIGQDATLNWNDKDLKIKNTSDYSIYIRAKFEDQKVNVKIYGQPLKDGITIKIQNEIVEEITPSDTEIRYTSNLPIGVRQTVRKARVGYKVKVYRIFLKDGVEIDRELISTDLYPALNKIVLIGRNTQDK